MTITEFLMARIDEDEVVASEMGRTELYEGGWSTEHEQRVLRECEAKRVVVDDWAESMKYESWQFNPKEVGYFEGLYEAVKVICAIYSDHPDYQPEWAV